MDAAIAISNGKIVDVGKSERVLKKYSSDRAIDATGHLVMPGFVDPHTHAVFAGSREHELEMKLNGLSYMEILRRGGGILRTVGETRKTSFNEIVTQTSQRLNSMLQHGTTTAELKSGYGLSVEHELKLLEAIRQLNNSQQLELVPTFLGAHAIPPEHEGQTDEFVDEIIREMLPRVASSALATFCDVFCEKGVFSAQQSRAILKAARALGLDLKLHADEFAWSGGAELAAELGATSADHLIHASKEGLMGMRKSGVIAVLLPAASLTLLMDRFAQAHRMRELGIPLALGTDLSPSCWVENQQFVLALACLKLRMTQEEAIVGATINAAHAIKKGANIGSLEKGKDADVLVLDCPSYRFLGYRFTTNLVQTVIKRGHIVVEDGELVDSPRPSRSGKLE